jgi:hypothetical protein
VGVAGLVRAILLAQRFFAADLNHWEVKYWSYLKQANFNTGILWLKNKKVEMFFFSMPEINHRIQRMLAAGVVNFELCHIDFLGGVYIRYKHYPSGGVMGRNFFLSAKEKKTWNIKEYVVNFIKWKQNLKINCQEYFSKPDNFYIIL